jgi:hypothetical protein
MDKEEREYILITDINGIVLRTAEVKKGSNFLDICAEDALNDPTQPNEVIALEVQEEELEMIRNPSLQHPFDQLPSRVRALVDKKKAEKDTKKKRIEDWDI